MCAKIYPIKEDLDDCPVSEKIVYDFLSGLSDSFIIFHSVHWLKRNHKWKSTWKENDFIILHRDLGGLVLEVKGGDVKYESGAFCQKNILTGETNILSEEKRNDPLSQAIDGIYHYRNLISSIKFGLDNRYPIEAAVWFPSCNVRDNINTFPLPYREAQGAILDQGSFSIGRNCIYNIFAFYNSKEKVNISDEEFSSIVASIATDFELIATPESKKTELDYSFIRLTNEQMGLLDYISEQRQATIQGAAGSGKTLIAREAARRFGEAGRKVLFLCYNKLLYQFLSHSFPNKNVIYYNLHSFISKYNYGAGDISKVENRVKALQKIDWDNLDFDDVIIDEGQDFENDEIIYFKDFCELKEGHFFVFYDKNQILFGQGALEWMANSECKLVLTNNCRNTYEIAVTANNVLGLDINQKVNMIHGAKTTVSFVKGEPLQKLASLIKFFTNENNGYSYGDIVILTLKSENDSILKDINKISGIPISREKNNSTVFFTSAKKYKGLESKVIVIIDIDGDAFSKDECKRGFYVACSRAMHRLALFINGNEDHIRNISEFVSNDNKYNATGKIVMRVQAQVLEL